MTYNPLNATIYAAAFAGAIAGIGTPNGAFITDPVTGDYANVAIVAAAFAQAVDTAWGGTIANTYDVNAITAASTNVFARGPGYPLIGALTNQSNWTIVAIAIVALVKQGDTNASSVQNVVLPPYGQNTNTWLTQFTWYINPVSGNDKNQGNTPATAIKTFAQFRARIGGSSLLTTSPYRVNFLAASTESLNVNFPDPSDAILIIDFSQAATLISQAGVTTFHLTAFTAADGSTNGEYWLIQATEALTTAVIRKRIRFTSGAANGYFCWIENLGLPGGNIRITQPQFSDPAAAGPTDGQLVPAVPSAGDTFVIEELAEAGTIRFQSTRNGIRLVSASVGKSSGVGLEIELDSINSGAIGCALKFAKLYGQGGVCACLLDGQTNVDGFSPVMWSTTLGNTNLAFITESCLYSSYPINLAAVIVQYISGGVVHSNALFQNIRMYINPGLTLFLGSNAVADFAIGGTLQSHIFLLQEYGSAQIYQSAFSFLWSIVNLPATCIGLDLGGAGCFYIYEDTPPHVTVTGGGDMRLHGVVKNVGDAHPWLNVTDSSCGVIQINS